MLWSLSPLLVHYGQALHDFQRRKEIRRVSPVLAAHGMLVFSPTQRSRCCPGPGSRPGTPRHHLPAWASHPATRPGPRRSAVHYATSHWLGQLPPAAGLVPLSSTAVLIGCWEGRPPCGSPGSWGGLVPAPAGWGWFPTTGVGAARGSWCQPPWQHLGTTWQTPTGHRVYLRRASTSSGASCQRRYPGASSDSQGYKHPLLVQFGLEKGWQRGVYE